MDFYTPQELVAIERHNLEMALAAFGIFLLVIILHRVFFKGWKPTGDLTSALRGRLQLLSLGFSVVLPLWWVSVHIPQLFFLSEKFFDLALFVAMVCSVESLRLWLNKRSRWTGWPIFILVYCLPVAWLIFSIADFSLVESAGIYTLGTVGIFFVFLHLVYFYLFSWATFQHPLANILRRRLKLWAYLAILAFTLYFVSLLPPFAELSDYFSQVLLGLVGLLFFLVLAEAMIATVFDFYFPIERKVEIPSFFRDLARGLAYIALFLGFVSLVLKRDLNSLLVGSAVITVSIGFALQETLGNFFAGLALRLSRPYAMGEDVKVGELAGRVSKIDWRQTTIYTYTGDYVSLPNSLVAKVEITNYSSPTVLHAREVSFGAHYRHPPNQVIAAALAAIAGIDEIKKTPSPEVHLLDFQDLAILYRIRLWIDDYRSRFLIETKVRTALWYTFNREDIEFPYPIRTIISEGVKEVQDQERVLSFLSSVDFLEALGPEALEVLAKRAKFQLFAVGERICRQGDYGHIFYIIRSGRVGVEVRDAQGEVFLNTEMAVGSYFGEMALLTGEPRSATVFAIDDSELLSIDKEDLRAIMVSNRQVEETISKVLAQRQLVTEKARGEAQEMGEQSSGSSASLGGRLEHLTEQFLRKIHAFFFN